MAYPGKKLNLQGVFHSRATQAEFFDHFMDADCLSRWNTLESDANSSVELQTTGRAGVVNIICDTDLNGEAYLYSNGVFKWNGLLPMMFQGRMVGDADTAGQYSWIAGFVSVSAFGSGDLIADGGLDVGYNNVDYAAFFKPYNTNRISVIVATSASSYKIIETESVQQADPPSGNVPFVGLRIDVIPHGDGDFDVVFFVDEEGGLGWQQCMRLADHKPIKHRMFYDPNSSMAIGAGLKNGKASEEALLRIDYMGGVEHATRDAGRE
jgi:hypothetical protein